jgi:excisionase family DNA binding protein
LPGFAAFRTRLGTSLVQRAGGAEGVRFVSVRECARVLGVSTATVYKAVAAGWIPHIRVSSVIRIPLSNDGPRSVTAAATRSIRGRRRPKRT